jgi:hypothetical protein
MQIIAKVGKMIQRLFGEVAELAAETAEVIQRNRKFSASTLLRTFVLGVFKNPRATDEQLAQMAAHNGVEVTPQAIEQRHTQRTADFLEIVCRQAGRMAVNSDAALASILERFTSVTFSDGSTISLPDTQQAKFAGCGGSYESGKSAMKLQTDIDYRGGAITFEVEQGKSPDGATPRQHERRGKGSLRVTDLGFFNLAVFAEQKKNGEYFLSRLQPGVEVRLRETSQESGESREAFRLLRWLSKQSKTRKAIDQKVLVGKEEKLACRLIALRVPEDVANERRRKLREELKRKGREPSAERLEHCDWTILITNVPVEMMSVEEALILYRARWQVELLFKRWKSQNLVAELSGATDVRQMIRVWSRLIMSLMQHWLLLATVWGDPTKSLNKVCEAIREFAGRLAASMESLPDLVRTIADMYRILASTCRRNKRSEPGTVELLNDSGRLEYRLT